MAKITEETKINWYENIARKQCKTARHQKILAQQVKIIAEGWK